MDTITKQMILEQQTTLAIIVGLIIIGLSMVIFIISYLTNTNKSERERLGM